MKDRLYQQYLKIRKSAFEFQPTHPKQNPYLI